MCWPAGREVASFAHSSGQRTELAQRALHQRRSSIKDRCFGKQEHEHAPYTSEALEVLACKSSSTGSLSLGSIVDSGRNLGKMHDP